MHFGLIYKLIRRLHEYPIITSSKLDKLKVINNTNKQMFSNYFLMQKVDIKINNDCTKCIDAANKMLNNFLK